MGYGGEVMADEQIADSKGVLEMLELVHDLRPDRDVECRDRLVEHDKPWVCCQGSGDRDPLPLSAAELVRK